MKQELELIHIFFGVGGGKCSGCGTNLTPQNESIANGGQCQNCDPECNDDSDD